MKSALAQEIASYFAIFISIILVMTLYFYYTDGEEPCPLCYLQQASMIGIALSELLNVRFGVFVHHYLMGLVCAILGGLISFYQLYLNDFSFHTFKGVNFLGLHLFVWSLIIFCCSTLGITLLLVISEKKRKRERMGLFAKVASTLFLIVVLGVAATALHIAP